MSHDKETEIRRQFLDEAQEYLDTLDAALLELSNNRIEVQKINAALRAAHSIKGGAGMMGFHQLSQLAHRLEDFFKVLKTQHQSLDIDPPLENLLLAAVSSLRIIIDHDRQAQTLTQSDVQAIDQVFEQLHDRLGDPQAEDAASVLAPEGGQDIVAMLFETEVEGCLQRLESVLSDPTHPCLQEEVTILAQELGGLGEMLQLEAFCQLCADVAQTMTAGTPDATVAIAQSALQAWRKTQALVLTGQLDHLPTAIVAAPLKSATQPLTIPDAPLSAPLEKQHPGRQPLETAFSLQNELLEFEPLLNVESWDQLQENWEATELTANSELWATADLFQDPELQAADSLTQEIWTDLHAQPDSQPKPQSVRESQVTDFKVLEMQPQNLPAPAEADENATVRVAVRQLHGLNDLLAELTIERNGLDLYLKRLRSLTQTLVHRVRRLDDSNLHLRIAYDRITPHSQFRLPMALQARLYENANADLAVADISTQTLQTTEFDSLELDQYGDLHALSQQVMETIVQIQEATTDAQLSLDDAEQVARDLNKTSKQLQTQLTQIRMRPLSDVVDRFPRALREWGLQYGKQASLVIQGGDTLIDRTLLDAINDPLMHLLRNAFDHGIELPQTRHSRGKPEVGTIEISAFHRGNRTFISIRDDGNGIPLEKVRNRAIAMGLDTQLLNTASDTELLSLIFEPGFSTSTTVTELSGRGVGMDVVRESLRQIRGEISVETRTGIGTTFTLSVPFMLSVVPALLVESNGLLLAIPTDAIAEIFLLQPEQVIRTLGSDILNWQGQLVQLLRLSHWLQFNCPHHPHGLESAPNFDGDTVLLIKHQEQTIALQIDRAWNEQEVAIRRAESTIPLPIGFTGCAIVGDGRVVPLVNVNELLDWMLDSDYTNLPTGHASYKLAGTELDDRSAAIATALPTTKSTILIVDDSINVRRFLALALERAGFRVEQAKDGQEALEKLQRGLSVQAVICDIEMPRLDGYGFLAKLKADRAFARLPIAMLTSRSSEKHRQLAMSLGAAAYFSKPYNEQSLLKQLITWTNP